MVLLIVDGIIKFLKNSIRPFIHFIIGIPFTVTEWRMLRMICGVTLEDTVESTVSASRVGLDDLEEHLRQKRLRWLGHVVRREEEEIRKSVGFENYRTKKERQTNKAMD